MSGICDEEKIGKVPFRLLGTRNEASNVDAQIMKGWFFYEQGRSY